MQTTGVKSITPFYKNRLRELEENTMQVANIEINTQTEDIVLTPKGHAHILAELDRLVTVDRPEVSERIRDAKDFGDLQENAEYEAAKNAQAFIEGRIQELKWILSMAREIEDGEITTDVVGLGSLVTLRDIEFDEDWTFTLVSPYEANPEKHAISDQSPIGMAIKGHEAGERIEVKTPGGVTPYEILAITK
jgi:transcription elongation factor GreA